MVGIASVVSTLLVYVKKKKTCCWFVSKGNYSCVVFRQCSFIYLIYLIINIIFFLSFFFGQQCFFVCIIFFCIINGLNCFTIWV